MVRARSIQFHHSVQTAPVGAELHAAVGRKICAPPNDEISRGFELKVRPAHDLDRRGDLTGARQETPKKDEPHQMIAKLSHPDARMGYLFSVSQSVGKSMSERAVNCSSHARASVGAAR